MFFLINFIDFCQYHVLSKIDACDCVLHSVSAFLELGSRLSLFPDIMLSVLCLYTV